MLPLYIETWIWWGFIILVIISRIVSRVLVVGSAKRFQSDDYIMLFATGTYTALIVTINIVSSATTNLLPPGFDVNSLTESDIHKRQYGSKLTLVVEQCQILTTWAVKFCMLIMYSRLTIRRTENFAIKLLGGYTLFTFVFMEIFYFGVWCRPFQNYWAVPTPNPQCSAATNHLITNAVFNISTDALILCIALPMFIKTRLPLRKKVAIVSIFSLGSFVILCAILNKYYSFSNPFGDQWTYWYVRESSTAILTANAPYLWALLRRLFHFRALDSLSGERYGYTNTNTRTYATNHTQTQRKGSSMNPNVQEIDMDDLLRPDVENCGGIHREIEFVVTEDSRHTSTHNGDKDGFSLSSKSDWAETWVHSTGTTNNIEGGGGDLDTTALAPQGETETQMQMPKKAVIKDRSST